LYPVLFRLGSFTVTGYAGLIDAGLLAGAAIAWLAARRRGLGVARVLDAALAAAVGGVIGGRAAYVAAKWAYYQDHVRRALRPWEGGLSWHGALAGGMVGVLAYCAIRRTSPRAMLDVLAPGVATLATCAWLGCLMNSCGYGIETYPGQGVLWALSLELPDLYGIRAPRVAVQLLGAGWSAVTLAALVFAGRRPRCKGLAFPLWVALYGVGSFGLGFLRADEVAMVAGWRADQVADLALVVTGAVTLAVGRARDPKDPNPDKPEPNRISRKDAKTRRKDSATWRLCVKLLAQCARISVPRY
jgi:phosphatidylglycerol:prolipoprotein diacylglycerol transferase